MHCQDMKNICQQENKGTGRQNQTDRNKSTIKEEEREIFRMNEGDLEDSWKK